MISPWTTIIVHVVSSVRDILFLAGTVCAILIFLGGMMIITAPNEKEIKEIGKKLIEGSCIIIALAVTAHILIPPSPALARVLVVHQLPEDADIEVVDELVYRVCKEATGR